MSAQIEKSAMHDKFLNQQPLYQRLGSNIEQALKFFLDAETLPYLDVYHRVKRFDSFFEKISRKNYADPFEEIEDVCGIRIICYYVSDIQKIKSIIEKEFEIIETEDKSESLGLKEFAYRSVHYIVKIRKSWSDTPNYRGLDNLKIEIQIRTILMHAWAEVEHKLNYKSDAQVPAKFQRKLFTLSAKFEEADGQFDELKEGISEYRAILTAAAKNAKQFDTKQDFNIDSFSAFLAFHFPGQEVSSQNLSRSFNFLSQNHISFDILDDTLKIYKPYFQDIAKDFVLSGYRNDVSKMPTELLFFALDANGVRNYENTMASWKSVVEKWLVERLETQKQSISTN